MKLMKISDKNTIAECLYRQSKINSQNITFPVSYTSFKNLFKKTKTLYLWATLILLFGNTTKMSIPQAFYITCI